ncbi:protein of unknown function [Sterolibacterium denitrificans]|uniref:Uncharacterized protein n=1 Tax=Sterolibacterium denitrificans TaxID=157592 RepID=A0A7Z7MVR4_9PROT|nr:protein of unknown function [Sterolibacterium denitrificans]
MQQNRIPSADIVPFHPTPDITHSDIHHYRSHRILLECAAHPERWMSGLSRTPGKRV